MTLSLAISSITSSSNFRNLELKKLIVTCYKSNSDDLFSKHDSERGKYIDYNGETEKNKADIKTKIVVRVIERRRRF